MYPQGPWKYVVNPPTLLYIWGKSFTCAVMADLPTILVYLDFIIHQRARISVKSWDIEVINIWITLSSKPRKCHKVSSSSEPEARDWLTSSWYITFFRYYWSSSCHAKKKKTAPSCRCLEQRLIIRRCDSNSCSVRIFSKKSSSKFVYVRI